MPIKILIKESMKFGTIHAWIIKIKTIINMIVNIAETTSCAIYMPYPWVYNTIVVMILKIFAKKIPKVINNTPILFRFQVVGVASISPDTSAMASIPEQILISSKSNPLPDISTRPDDSIPLTSLSKPKKLMSQEVLWAV